MDSKITLQDLAYDLASRSKLSQEAADVFVRNFFETVRENVTDAKGVKVKGLGTFKLVNVQDRESVDVNTGERILIPGHPKVVFTPDNELRTKVNKPFEAFSTIVINEGTSIEDMERVDSYDMASAALEEETPDRQSLEWEEEPETNTPTPIEELDEEHDIDDTDADNGIDSDSNASAEYPAASADEDNSPSGSDKGCDAPVVKHEESADEHRHSGNECQRNNMHTFLYALLIFGLMLCSYFAGYNRWLCPCLDSTTPPQTFAVKDSQTVPVDTQEADTDTVMGEQGQEQDTLQKCSPEEEADETAALVDDGEDYAALASGFKQVPDGDYLITGTLKVRIMKRGDNLYKFAKEELGDKGLVRYIIVHNGFSNPNVVPLGYEVKIPHLVQNKQ